jgi:dTDP-4-amino-4,6-dideoxygalactose transaminase
MTPVPFTDLAAMASEVWPDVERAFLACLLDGPYIGGSPVTSFEREWAAYCGAGYAVGDTVRAELARRKIQTGVHYPVPCHLQPPLRRYADGPLPVAEQAAGELLSLPMFPHLTDGQVDFVCEALCEALRKRTTSSELINVQ